MELLDHQVWMQQHGNTSAPPSNQPPLGDVARQLNTTLVDPRGLSAFVACRLIALDKCPGAWPIGIGSLASPLQVCAGHLLGCEAAVNAMCQVYESPENEAVTLINSSNAFTSLNREAALCNIQQLCPPLSRIIINTYREDPQLFIDGKHTLL